MYERSVDNMIIYTDSNVGLFGTQMTPAHTHAATTDFANILDDLARGNIPCNTGKPFPVNWKTENNNVDENDLPWFTRTNYQQMPSYGFVNPWKE